MGAQSYCSEAMHGGQVCARIPDGSPNFPKQRNPISGLFHFNFRPSWVLEANRSIPYFEGSRPRFPTALIRMGIENDLRRVEEHVAEARRFVQRQKGLIVRLRAAGVNTLDAQRILWPLNRTFGGLSNTETASEQMSGGKGAAPSRLSSNSTTPIPGSSPGPSRPTISSLQANASASTARRPKLNLNAANFRFRTFDRILACSRPAITFSYLLQGAEAVRSAVLDVAT